MNNMLSTPASVRSRVCLRLLCSLLIRVRSRLVLLLAPTRTCLAVRPNRAMLIATLSGFDSFGIVSCSNLKSLLTLLRLFDSIYIYIYIHQAVSSPPLPTAEMLAQRIENRWKPTHTALMLPISKDALSCPYFPRAHVPTPR